MFKSNEVYGDNVESKNPLVSAELLRRTIPASEAAMQTVSDARAEIKDILDRKSSRIVVLLGPCSIHSSEQALLVGQRILALQKTVGDKFLLVMRAYFEKPRSSTGWKGLINDPELDQSFDMNKGLAMSRKILIDLNALGVPCGTEVLSQEISEYMGELLAWTCIGARTTESQIHREWASGISSPVGCKNSVDGRIGVAINAILAISEPSSFFGHNHYGQRCIVNSRGNKYAHVVLRGGISGTNYDPVNVERLMEKLVEKDLPLRAFIDCSHANSGKIPEMQKRAFLDAVAQIVDGNQAIMGLMLEVNIQAGGQEFVYGKTKKVDLSPEFSITDKCIAMDEAQELLQDAIKLLTPENTAKAA